MTCEIDEIERPQGALWVEFGDLGDYVQDLFDVAADKLSESGSKAKDVKPHLLDCKKALEKMIEVCEKLEQLGE